MQPNDFIDNKAGSIPAASTYFSFISIFYRLYYIHWINRQIAECDSSMRNFAPRVQVTEIILLSAKAGTHLLGQVAGSHSSTP
jgi:hypothetical protein